MPIEIKEDAICTTAEAAEAAGLALLTVRRKCASGEIRANKRGRRFYTLGRDLRAWLLGNGNGDRGQEGQ